MTFFNKLSFKLISAFVVFVLIPIYVTMFFFYQAYSHALESKVRDYSSKSFEQMHQLVGSRLLDIVRASSDIMLNPLTRQILEKDGNESDWRSQLDRKAVDDAFEKAQNIGSGSVLYMTLVSRDGRVFGNWPSLPGKEQATTDWYLNALEHSPFPVWLPLQPNYLRKNNNKSGMITMVQAMEGNSGVLRTSIEQTQIDQWLSEIKPIGTTLIYNEAGDLIYGHDEGLPAALKNDFQHNFNYWNSADNDQFNKAGYRIIAQGLPLKGWTLVQLLHEAELYKDIRLLLTGFILFSVISLVTFIGITIFITRRITRPLIQLKWAMKRVGEGNWNAEISTAKKDEIGQIALHFNLMVQQIKDLFEQLRAEERKKSEIYFESLLAQISPHFLFNTLNSIKWTATLSKADHVADLITSLGKILEMSTSRVKDRITLSQELEYVKHYMNLQYARFGERVSLQIQVPDELMTAIIPKFVIQPFVENAIIHGFEQHERRGEISIEAQQAGNELVLFVRDNGKGISSDKLQQVFGEPDSSSHHRISGIGLRNVQERIKLMYGPNYGMIVSSEENIGSVFRILVPLVMEREDRRYVQGSYRG